MKVKIKDLKELPDQMGSQSDPLQPTEVESNKSHPQRIEIQEENHDKHKRRK
jgi:hypothetical protein